MTTMDFGATLNALRRLRVETGSLACLGCGHEHNCSTHGCAILRNTVEYMEAALANYDNLSALVDRLETELKSERLSTAELRYRLANEWVSVEERLPTDERPVLVFVGYADTMTGFITTSSYFCFDANPHWQWDGLVQDEQKTLFWMPLPEPPGKETSMRLIDANELLVFPYSESAGTDEQIEDWIEECGLSDEEVIDRAKKLCWMVIEGFVNVIKTAPTLTPPNEPLTLEELREMDGEPVWSGLLKRWGLVKVSHCGIGILTKCGEYDVTRMKLYRRPPEGDADA